MWEAERLRFKYQIMLEEKNLFKRIQNDTINKNNICKLPCARPYSKHFVLNYLILIANLWNRYYYYYPFIKIKNMSHMKLNLSQSYEYVLLSYRVWIWICRNRNLIPEPLLLNNIFTSLYKRLKKNMNSRKFLGLLLTNKM